DCACACTSVPCGSGPRRRTWLRSSGLTRWRRPRRLRMTRHPGAATRGLTASDTDITRQVEGRLSKDSRLKRVDVRTERGAVILTGAVANIGASTRASELARGVPG